MWGYKTGGIIRTAADSTAYAALKGTGAFQVGDWRYVDLNGDGTIDAKDQTILGDANPDWVWGLNNRMTFGKFDLSALLTAVRGGSLVSLAGPA